MSLRDFNKISAAASKYWESQLKSPQKKEDVLSTNCGCHNNTQQTVLEIAAVKAEEYLFPTEMRISNKEQSIEIEEQKSLQDNDSEMQVSSSIVSESVSKRESRKSRTTSNKKKLKKRFTHTEELFIMEQMRQGSNFNLIAQQIPGSTVGQIKKHFLKKLKVLDHNSDSGIADTISKIQNLFEQYFLQISDETTEDRVNVLKNLISDVENHLHQTKQLILQKYLTQFQQE